MESKHLLWNASFWFREESQWRICEMENEMGQLKVFGHTSTDATPWNEKKSLLDYY